MNDPNNFFLIAASVADAAALNGNGIETLLGNDLSTFFVKGNPVSSNGSRLLPKSPPDCPILDNSVVYDFILADELFEKDLANLEAFVLLNNNLCVKLVPSLELPITFDLKFSCFFFFSGQL